MLNEEHIRFYMFIDHITLFLESFRKQNRELKQLCKIQDHVLIHNKID